jgi:hypothetical protein
MNISEIAPAKGFPAQFVSRLCRSFQNTPQVLRHTLREVNDGQLGETFSL